MIIIDASAIVKLSLEELWSDETRDIVDSALSEGEVLSSPDIALGEALNSLWKHNVLLKDLTDSEYISTTAGIVDFWKNVDKISIETLVFDAIDIAKKHRLTVYDSFYVAAAISNKSPLLTFDQQISDKYKELDIKLVKVAE